MGFLRCSLGMMEATLTFKGGRQVWPFAIMPMTGAGKNEEAFVRDDGTFFAAVLPVETWETEDGKKLITNFTRFGKQDKTHSPMPIHQMNDLCFINLRKTKEGIIPRPSSANPSNDPKTVYAHLKRGKVKLVGGEERDFKTHPCVMFSHPTPAEA